MKNIVRNVFFVSIIISLTSVLFAQKIAKGPYLLKPSGNEITIRWEMDGNEDCSLKYGLDNDLVQIVKAELRGVKENGYLYEVKITDLHLEAKYNYQILFAESQTEEYSFKTVKENESKFSFVAMGDSRSNPEIFSKITDGIKKQNPDFIISMGDIVETGGNYQQWGEFYFSVAKDLLTSIPLISTLGDHETNGDNGELFRHFLLEKESVNKAWFSFDYGNAHFVSLDYRYPNNQEMIDWFVEDISQSKAKWKFVYFHCPAYNLGGHRSAWGRDVWPKLFREYNVDIVFAGHSHLYERFYPVRPENKSNSWPVTYITTGGAGAGLYDVVFNKNYLAVAESVNHYINIDISGDSLFLVAHRNDSSILDEFLIIKKGLEHDISYTKIVQSQERLDLFTNLAKSLSTSLNYLPIMEYGTSLIFEFNSNVAEDIPFAIKLTKESEKWYRIEAVSNTLTKGSNKKVELKLFKTTTEEIRVSNWGEVSPEIYFKMNFKYQGREEEIFSKPIDYWPSIF